MTGLFDRFRHGTLRELLSSYIDGEVSDSERRRVESHLSRCEECRQELESLRLTVAALRQLPEVQATRSFAISAPPEPARAGFRWALGVRMAASAAAVVLVGLIVADVTGLLVQSDESEWTRQSYRDQSDAPPAAPAPARAPPAPAPAAAPAPAPAPTTAPARPAVTAVPTPAPAPAAADQPEAVLKSSDEGEIQSDVLEAPALATASPEPALSMALDAPAEPSQTLTASPTSTATHVPTSTPTTTPTPLPTRTPTPTSTLTPTVTSTPTPRPTDTPAPTSTPTPTVTSTPTPRPTDTPTPMPSPTPTSIADDLGLAEEREARQRPALPLLQLEIALGILLIALIGVTFWMSRRKE